MPAAATGAALGANAANPAPRAILDLRYFYLRNNADNQRQRLSEFLQKSVMPAMKRAGAGPFGAFSSNIAPDGPFILLLTSYPSLAAMEEITNKLNADEEFMKGLESFNALSGIGYERQQRMLLRAFPSIPQIEVPSQGEGRRGGRLFEIRTYESHNSSTLRRKIGMFDNGEIAIFRKVGMTPVFFGETLVGPKMPNLTYMLAYDDLAHREKTWRAFGSDPEWAKLRATPGLSDPEVVSNISNFLVSPLPFSQIR
jgi:hypothetical protein